MAKLPSALSTAWKQSLAALCMFDIAFPLCCRGCCGKAAARLRNYLVLALRVPAHHLTIVFQSNFSVAKNMLGDDRTRLSDRMFKALVTLRANTGILPKNFLLDWEALHTRGISMHNVRDFEQDVVIYRDADVGPAVPAAPVAPVAPAGAGAAAPASQAGGGSSV